VMKRTRASPHGDARVSLGTCPDDANATPRTLT